jgi:hypothetical protein
MSLFFRTCKTREHLKLANLLSPRYLNRTSKKEAEINSLGRLSRGNPQESCSRTNSRDKQRTCFCGRSREIRSSRQHLQEESRATLGTNEMMHADPPRFRFGRGGITSRLGREQETSHAQIQTLAVNNELRAKSLLPWSTNKNRESPQLRFRTAGAGYRDGGMKNRTRFSSRTGLAVQADEQAPN